MLRALLEKRVGKLTINEFAVVMQIVTDDIKFNNIHFHKKTTKADVIKIAEVAAKVIFNAVYS